MRSQQHYIPKGRHLFFVAVQLEFPSILMACCLPIRYLAMVTSWKELEVEGLKSYTYITA